jgi:acetylglutamate kinase
MSAASAWLVVKLGGDVLEGAARMSVARDLAAARGRRRVVVVHGGGAQVTDLSQRLGVGTTIVAGRRVTDAATIEVLELVIAGRLNVELCVALRASGVPAVGLHAGSGVLRATKRPPRVISGAGPDPVDLGLVGDVSAFDATLLGTLADADRVPVLACLGLDEDASQVLNLNADLVASQLAAHLGADALVAVTAVGGVRTNKDDASTRIARLTIAQARSEITSGRVQGGMIPKLEEAFAPLEAGVGAVHIVGPGEIATSLAQPGSVGTVLVR